MCIPTCQLLHLQLTLSTTPCLPATQNPKVVAQLNTSRNEDCLVRSRGCFSVAAAFQFSAASSCGGVLSVSNSGTALALHITGAASAACVTCPQDGMCPSTQLTLRGFSQLQIDPTIKCVGANPPFRYRVTITDIPCAPKQVGCAGAAGGAGWLGNAWSYACMECSLAQRAWCACLPPAAISAAVCPTPVSAHLALSTRCHPNVLRQFSATCTMPRQPQSLVLATHPHPGAHPGGSVRGDHAPGCEGPRAVPKSSPAHVPPH